MDEVTVDRLRLEMPTRQIIALRLRLWTQSIDPITGRSIDGWLAAWCFASFNLSCIEQRQSAFGSNRRDQLRDRTNTKSRGTNEETAHMGHHGKITDLRCRRATERSIQTWLGVSAPLLCSLLSSPGAGGGPTRFSFPSLRARPRRSSWPPAALQSRLEGGTPPRPKTRGVGRPGNCLGSLVETRSSASPAPGFLLP